MGMLAQTKYESPPDSRPRMHLVRKQVLEHMVEVQFP